MVVLYVTIVLLLTVANGLLAMSELAMVSARPARLQQLADEGKRGAAKAQVLAADPNRFLSTVQTGITLIGILNGVVGGATLSEPVSNLISTIPVLDRWSGTIGAIIVVVGITYVSLIVGELVPKQIALQRAEGVACFLAPFLDGLSKATRPVVTLLARSSEVLLRLLGVDPDAQETVTEEEVRLLIRQGTESGVFDESQSAIVTEIFKIADRNVGELMTPRHLIHHLDLGEGDAWNRQVMEQHPHTIYPVTEGSLDNVIGIVSTRDLWQRQVSGQSVDVRDAMKPALFVPQLAPVLDVTEQMRRQQSPMALVIDEYGGLDGLLTFNDLISDIIGELDVPDPTQVKGAIQRADGSWLVDGILAAHEMMELLAIEELPGEEEGRYETVGGFVMDQLGRIPAAGDLVTFGAFTYEVVDMDGNRIDKVLVMPVAHDVGDAPTED